MPGQSPLERRVDREKRARQEAERLLEEKSLELYRTNSELLALSTSLEERVEKRTHELELRNRELINANQSRERFLANITHELRSPLQGIIGFADLGVKRVETAKPEKLTQYFRTISNSGQTLLTLVNDLLDLSKLNNDSLTVQAEATDLDEIVAEISSEFKLRCLEKSLTVSIDANGDTHCLADRFRISQVMRNLFSNAVKFSSPKTTIELRLYGDGEWVCLAIANRGIGIPEAEADSIFNPFVESSKTANSAGGTGLGLAICRKIVEAHNGTIALTENTDVTRFEVRLPATEALTRAA